MTRPFTTLVELIHQHRYQAYLILLTHDIAILEQKKTTLGGAEGLSLCWAFHILSNHTL